MKKFVCFTRENGTKVYLDVNEITGVSDLKNKRDNAKSMIYVKGGSFGSDSYVLQEDPDRVMYSIDSALNPEFYEKNKEETAETKPATDNDFLEEIKNMCQHISGCHSCLYFNTNNGHGGCFFTNYSPCEWDLDALEESIRRYKDTLKRMKK